MARDFVAELGPRVLAYWELLNRLGPKLPPEKRRALGIRFDQAVEDSGLAEALVRLVSRADILCKEFGLELPTGPVVRVAPARRRKTSKAAAAKPPLPGPLGSTPADQRSQAASVESTPERPREGLVSPLPSGQDRTPPNNPRRAKESRRGLFLDSPRAQRKARATP